MASSSVKILPGGQNPDEGCYQGRDDEYCGLAQNAARTRAGGHVEDIVWQKPDFVAAATEGLSKVDGDFGAAGGVRDRAEDAGFLEVRIGSGAAGHAEELDDADALLLAEFEAAGFADSATEIDHFGALGGDGVVGEEFDVLGGIDFLGEDGERDLNGHAAAVGVLDGGGQGDVAHFLAAADLDAAAGSGLKAADGAQHFNEVAAALEWVDAGFYESADEEDGIGAELDQGDDDLGVGVVLAVQAVEFGLKLIDGEADSVDGADEGERDGTGGIEAVGALAEFFDGRGADLDNVAFAEFVAGAQRFCGGRHGGRGRLLGAGRLGK